MRTLMGSDWMPEFFIERVEFPNLYAVHSGIYGPLGWGVGSSSRLDALGKASAEYIRDRQVSIPERFLKAADLKIQRHLTQRYS